MSGETVLDEEPNANSLFGRMADQRRMALVHSHISKDMAILDLGCGSGWLVRTLRREGFNAIGIDQNLQHPNSRYLFQRSAYETGLANNSYHCIICLETIEHLEPRVYSEIKRVSKNGGKLLLTTPKKEWNWLVELLSTLGLSEPLITPHINLVDPHDIPFSLEESGSFMLLEWYGVYTIRKE